jgi:putative ABC transport system permease protein
MMDDLDQMDPALEDQLAAVPNGALLGKKRLERLNKRVGDKFTVTSFNLKGLVLEFQIVGMLPEGRYDMSAIMNREFLNQSLLKYEKEHPSPDPPSRRSLSLVWLRVPDDTIFRKVADQVVNSPEYTSPTVKCETAASGIATWLAPYKDMLWGLKWLLMPALLIAMALIMANAISISVRERRTEIAVLKVLGFGPGRILAIVLGEGVLLGGGAGLLSAGLTYLIVHVMMGGIKFPIAFIPMFDVYPDSLWWGPLVGALTALIGCLVPAWSACRVKVSDVFAKVA